jgi:hypothetical protein
MIQENRDDSEHYGHSSVCSNLRYGFGILFVHLPIKIKQFPP